MEVTITKENFASLKAGNLPLVVDFWATWCGPCRMVAPIIAELAKQYDGKIVVGKCDVEDNEELLMLMKTLSPSGRMASTSLVYSLSSTVCFLVSSFAICVVDPIPRLSVRRTTFTGSAEPIS